MKKLITILLSLIYYIGIAQYCGHSGVASGPGQCIPDTVYTEFGFYPEMGIALPPFVNGVPADVVIQFKNIDTLVFGGQSLYIPSLRIDSLGNMPPGLCWTTNKPDNTFSSGEQGCLRITGVPCAAAGQYKLKLQFTSSVGFTSGDDNFIRYYMRLKDGGQGDIAVDTNQTAANSFIPYNTAGCISGLAETNNNHGNINIVPNPFATSAKIQFNSSKAGTAAICITTLLGALVQQAVIPVQVGINGFTVPRNGLLPGIYFCSIDTGASTFTTRLIIAD